MGWRKESRRNRSGLLSHRYEEIFYYVQLVEEESTATVMAGLKEVIERKGVFCALYSDRGSHFWHTPKAGGKIDPHRLTQVGRALRELGVQMIPAYTLLGCGPSQRNL